MRWAISRISLGEFIIDIIIATVKKEADFRQRHPEKIDVDEDEDEDEDENKASAGAPRQPPAVPKIPEQ